MLPQLVQSFDVLFVTLFFGAFVEHNWLAVGVEVLLRFFIFKLLGAAIAVNIVSL